MIEAWLPTIVSGVLVGLVFYYMRSNRSEILAQVNRVEIRLKDDEDAYLTEDKHDLLCRNSQLELKAYISEVLETMQKQTDVRFDSLERLIKNGG